MHSANSQKKSHSSNSAHNLDSGVNLNLNHNHIPNHDKTNSSNNQNNQNNIIFQKINQEVAQKSYSKQIKYSDLVSAFRHFAIGGKYLNYEKFNECITSILTFDLPLIANTYLAEKLFALMDKNSNGEIYEVDFIEYWKLAFSDTNTKKQRKIIN